MTSHQPVHPDYAVGPDSVPVRMLREQVDGRFITVHWVTAGQVTHTTEEPWDGIRPILKSDLGAAIHVGEVWWTDAGSIKTKPPGGK